MNKMDAVNTSDILHLGTPDEQGHVSYVRETETDAGTLIRVGVAKCYNPDDSIPTEDPDAERVTLERMTGNQYRVKESSRSGPAKVNSAAYRSGWDSIFGAKQTVGQA